MRLLRQVLCWIATRHTSTEPAIYLDPLTHWFVRGHRCIHCGRQVELLERIL